MSPPPNETGDTANAARTKRLSNAKIVPFHIKINGSDSGVCQSEKERLWQEFRRTRNEEDFKAFLRDVTGREVRAMAFDEPCLFHLAEAMLRQI
jgi:hypothetical protein